MAVQRWVGLNPDRLRYEMILALRDTNQKEPFYMDVQDDEDGEQVEIYIG